VKLYKQPLYPWIALRKKIKGARSKVQSCLTSTKTTDSKILWCIISNTLKNENDSLNLIKIWKIRLTFCQFVHPAADDDENGNHLGRSKNVLHASRQVHAVAVDNQDHNWNK
jgi:hypothetical protein